MGEHFKKINPIDDETWKRVQEMIDNPPEDLITSDLSRPYEGEQCVDVELSQKMYEEKVNDPAYSVYRLLTDNNLQSLVIDKLMENEVKSTSGLFDAKRYPAGEQIQALKIEALPLKGNDEAWRRLIRDMIKQQSDSIQDDLLFKGNEEAWYRLIRDMIKQQSDSIQDDLLFNSRNNLKI